MLSETFVLLAQMCVRCVPCPIYWYRMCMLVLLACMCRNQCRLSISYPIAVWLQRKHVEINESPQKYAEEDYNKKDFTSVALCGPQWHRDLNIRRRHQYKSVHLFLQELFSLIWSASHANHDIKEHKQLFFHFLSLMVLALPVFFAFHPVFFPRMLFALFCLVSFFFQLQSLCGDALMWHISRIIISSISHFMCVAFPNESSSICVL